MTTIADIPLNFELPHVLILIWLGAGCLALWIAQKLHLPRQKSVNILLPMALGLMVFTLFIGTRFNYDFLIDDIDIIEKNPDVKDVNGWRNLWTNDYWAGRSTDNNLYRPITTLSYWINARLPLSGTIVNGNAIEIFPRYFRGVNIILLTGLAWLIALWLSHYVQQTAAWAVAFLFAGHCVHAEMVNYVVCRADLQAMLGVVGFLYMQRLAIESRWRWWSAGLALFSAIVALGSKETGLILVPAAMVQAWIGPRHANTEVTDDLEPTPRSVTIGWALLLGVPLLAFLIARFAVVGFGVDYVGQYMDDMRDNPLRTVSAVERIPAAFAIAWFYFKQIFSPDTSYYHLPAELPGWTSGDTIRGVTLIVVLAALLVAYLRRHRWHAIAIVLAAGQYLLVGNLLAPVGVYAANRLILPFSLAAAVLGAAFIHWFCGQSPRRRAVVILPTAIVICVMAFETQEVNHVWRTEARLMGRDRDLAPENPVAMYNFGTVRAREAVMVDRYVLALKLATELNDRVESAMHHPGAQGAPGVSAESVKPTLDNLRRLIAVPHETNQHMEQVAPLRDVISLYDRTIVQRAASLTTEDVTAAIKKIDEDLARNVEFSQRYWDDAIKLLGDAVALRPASLSARIEYARTLDLRGKKEEARIQYRELVNHAMADDDRNQHDLRVIEAWIRYGILSIELRRDKEGSEKSLIAAEYALAGILAKPQNIAPEKLKDLHTFNKNAKRWLGIHAYRYGDIRKAVRRHSELLLQYKDFREAIEDQLQWIELQRPPDAKDD